MQKNSSDTTAFHSFGKKLLKVEELMDNKVIEDKNDNQEYIRSIELILNENKALSKYITDFLNEREDGVALTKEAKDIKQIVRYCLKIQLVAAASEKLMTKITNNDDSRIELLGRSFHKKSTEIINYVIEGWNTPDSKDHRNFKAGTVEEFLCDSELISLVLGGLLEGMKSLIPTPSHVNQLLSSSQSQNSGHTK